MNDETLLLRQISPSWVQAGRVTSQAFRPTPKDMNLLSIFDGDRITPEKSWHYFTRDLGLKSTGVMGVTNFERVSVNVPLIEDRKPIDAHVSLDYTGLSNSQKENAGKVLTDKARTRGWLHREGSDSPPALQS